MLTSPLKVGQFTSRASVLHTALATSISVKPQRHSACLFLNDSFDGEDSIDFMVFWPKKYLSAAASWRKFRDEPRFGAHSRYQSPSVAMLQPSLARARQLLLRRVSRSELRRSA
jgi:hypothetical protein